MSRKTYVFLLIQFVTSIFLNKRKVELCLMYMRIGFQIDIS